MSHKSFKRKKIKEMESFLCAARMMGEGGGRGVSRDYRTPLGGLEWPRSCAAVTRVLSWAIRSQILTDGPTFMEDSSSTWSLLSSTRPRPSTFCWQKKDTTINKTVGKTTFVPLACRSSKKILNLVDFAGLSVV